MPWNRDDETEGIAGSGPPRRHVVSGFPATTARETPTDTVFPTLNGTWQRVNNVERRWHQVRKDTNLDWVTSHTFRSTVATLISERVDAETASQLSANRLTPSDTSSPE